MTLEYKKLSKDNLMEVLGKIEKQLGTEKLLSELVSSLSDYELQDNLEYVAKNNELDVFSKYDDTFDIDRLASWIVTNATPVTEHAVMDELNDLIEAVGKHNATYFKDSTATGISMYFDPFRTLSEAITYLKQCDIYASPEGYTIIPEEQ